MVIFLVASKFTKEICTAPLLSREAEAFTAGTVMPSTV